MKRPAKASTPTDNRRSPRYRDASKLHAAAVAYAVGELVKLESQWSTRVRVHVERARGLAPIANDVEGRDVERRLRAVIAEARVFVKNNPASWYAKGIAEILAPLRLVRPPRSTRAHDLSLRTLIVELVDTPLPLDISNRVFALVTLREGLGRDAARKAVGRSEIGATIFAVIHAEERAIVQARRRCAALYAAARARTRDTR